ncbi:molybdate ABC transporter substrate-binding protein [Sphingomonas sp. LaA6.9]|uniref:molybdate ABC transporter substrate-binding protein n=1 Tax=Sphingomonas sp. LaA6.9 TaxID=2919914 RepID=UPI001F4FC047|nr:molybdate ABC transporter substrate-binding protein [Sphingomonas sp. LaA6.9]MCJ8158433.1 molybdate ABC transporter substrate-binding protein [Sphingomonas sp. LaA6.9]
MHKLLTRLIILCLMALGTPATAQQRGPLVLAAASLQESLTAAANAWAAKGNARPVLSFAASSALARQIEAGAPADIFVSADEPWMDSVAQKGLIRKGTRVSFLANRLALIAPASSRVTLPIARGFPIARALGDGRLAMADPDAVPAGRYGKTALMTLGAWPSVANRIARAENVRAAMALVERGEAPLGIVYATDARASQKVKLVGLFPASSHPPITYPIATLAASRHPQVEGFRRFLISREGKAIFARFGFQPR